MEESNYYVRQISVILTGCIDRAVEVGKVAELTACLLSLGVSAKTPMINKAIKYFNSLRHDDGIWTTPLVTAQILYTLSKAGIMVKNEVIKLDEWADGGLWGQHTRDNPRLLCSSEIIEYLKDVDSEYIYKKAGIIVKTASNMWQRDISYVPYSFKAVAYVYIYSMIRQMNMCHEVEEKKDLYDLTLKRIERNVEEFGFLPQVLDRGVRKADPRTALMLCKTMNLDSHYERYCKDSFISKLNEQMSNYEKERQMLPFSYEDLCLYSLINYHISL